MCEYAFNSEPTGDPGEKVRESFSQQRKINVCTKFHVDKYNTFWDIPVKTKDQE